MQYIYNRQNRNLGFYKYINGNSLLIETEKAKTKSNFQ